MGRGQSNVLYGPAVRSNNTALLPPNQTPDWLKKSVDACVANLPSPQAVKLVASAQKIPATVDLPALKRRLAERRLREQLLPLAETLIRFKPVPVRLVQLKQLTEQAIIDLAAAIPEGEVTQVQQAEQVLLALRDYKVWPSNGLLFGLVRQETIRCQRLLESAIPVFDAVFVAVTPLPEVATGLTTLKNRQLLPKLWQQEAACLQEELAKL